MRYIDADALIERLEDDIKAIEDTEPVIAMGGIGALNTIKKAPTVEPERPKGKWVEVEKSEHGGLSIVSMRCNQCGRYAYLVLPKGTKCVYDYCPWCKADMSGVRMTHKSGELFLTLNKAVEVAVNQFDVDPVIARQEFEQKCYIPCPDYEKGFYDGLAEGRDLIEYAMENLLEEIE